MTDRTRPALPTIDIHERGAPKDGEPQAIDRRLFMQLLVFRVEPGTRNPSSILAAAVDRAELPSVIYEDLNDPRGVALLTWSEDPDRFMTRVRAMLQREEFQGFEVDPEYTMIGRTYAVGYERDVVDWILERPKRSALEEKWKWAVWYPLRRKGGWGRLDGKDRRRILGEHAGIGRAYGAAGHATDIRLACHGLDPNDNEYVIGILAEDLHRASHLVERMRATEQTADWIESLGPFFVGRVAHRRA